MPGIGSLTSLLLGLGSSAVSHVADLVFGELTRWVAAGAGSLLGALASVLTSTTTPDLTRGFPVEYGVMLAIGASVTVPLLVLAAIQAIVAQDLGMLARAVLLRLPVAVLVSAAATQLVSLALQASDEMSGALLAAAGHPVDGFVANLVTGLAGAAAAATGSAPGGVAVGGFAALLLAVVAAAVAFVLWLELVVRSAAVAASTLFLPLALAGLVWPATAHWARRLAETLLALVLAKVVIAGVLALAGVEVTGGTGIAGVVEGIALVLLATLAPFSLLRLVPMVEGGSVGHLDGIGRRAARAGAGAGGSVASYVRLKREDMAAGDGWGGGGPGDWAGPGGGGGRPRGGGGGPHVIDSVPMSPGLRLDTPEIQADADRIERELGSGGAAK